MIRKFIAIFLCLVFCSVFAEAPVVDYSIEASPEVKKAFTRPGSSYIPSDRSSLSSMQRLKRLERQVDNLNKQGLLERVEELQQENQTLRGKIDFLEHQNEQLDKQLKDFYEDINERLDDGVDVKKKAVVKNGEKKSVSGPEVTGEASVVSVAAGGGIAGTVVDKNKEKKKEEDKKKESIARTQKDMKEQQMYQTAIDLLPEKKHESRVKLRAYLKKYPKGAYAANAYYWLGEINYLERDFDAAEEEFKKVVEKYPDSRRAADAMLKLALVHANQGKEKQAKKELNDVIKRYPGTSAAHLAKEQLK